MHYMVLYASVIQRRQACCGALITGARWAEHSTPILRDTLDLLPARHADHIQNPLMAFNCIAVYFMDVCIPVHTVAECTMLMLPSVGDLNYIWIWNWIVLSCMQVHKCQYQLIKRVKYTETMEHQDLEALTGGPVQKATGYLNKGKIQYEQYE